MLRDLQYPLHITFKVSTFSNDCTVTDAAGKTLCYSRAKIMKLKEHVQIYRDESKSEVLYDNNADKWLDFNTTYVIKSDLGDEKGRVSRKGWASLWKSHYQVFDQYKQPDFDIREENPWAKVMDGVLGEIPFLGLLTGYMFNPKYLAVRPDGTEVVRISKEASMLGRRFKIDKLGEFEEGEEERAVLSIFMMILLERRRG